MPQKKPTSSEWWKAKEITSSRKLAAPPKQPVAKPGDSFLIVTEGEVTEPIYFKLLLNRLQLSTVRIKVIPGKASDPHHVVQTAVKEVQKLKRRSKKTQIANNELTSYDHVWAVVDTDHASQSKTWDNILKEAKKHKIQLAHSTPCFEYWLLLHLEYTTRTLQNGKAAKKTLENKLGTSYSTNKSTTETNLKTLLGNCPKAITNAKKARVHHTEANTPLPANPSTEVDHLAAALNDSALPHYRFT